MHPYWRLKGIVRETSKVTRQELNFVLMTLEYQQNKPAAFLKHRPEQCRLPSGITVHSVTFAVCKV